MVLEVSATPKPGNIDRDHNYTDTRFEHFLASAVGVYPILEKAARSDSGVGMLIREAVIESSRWQQGGNTHFGAFILLIPLIIASASSKNKDELRKRVKKVVEETTTRDAVELYRAFSISHVRVAPVGDLDLRDTGSIKMIEERGLTLYDLMEIASERDLLASEWVNSFPRTFWCDRSISTLVEETNINEAIVVTFLELLARNPDTLIQTKFGQKKAEEVSARALQVLEDIKERGFSASRIQGFDEELVKEGINPGACADIIIAGLFVSLWGGMRF
jgi:triphosphoribosyl-dephospho-CoA synthase